MTMIFGVPSAVLYGQLLLGLINGSFYAMLSLGLAVIFGMLNIVNFAHGAQYMLGAMTAWLLLNYAGIGYWWSLLLAPLIVGASGMVIERFLLRRLYKLDHLYGMLLTFGLALIFQGVLTNAFGSSGQPYRIPAALSGGRNLGFMFLPNYRAWVIVASLTVCLTTWYVIERTKLGAYLRAATENPMLVQAFGIRVPRMIMLTYGAGAALAALAGVLAAPIYQVGPSMGVDLIIVVFAVVVIGGMGSIMGSIVTGFLVGLIEGLTKAYYPEMSSTVVFVIMALVLLVRPAGLFGSKPERSAAHETVEVTGSTPRTQMIAFVAMAVLFAAAPLVVYPGFMMKAMLFALFACAFNLLAGYGKLVSFGHAMFLGMAGYVCGHAAKVWGFTPELAVLAGTGVAALLGLAVGWLTIRRSGIYFAMVTLAFAQMIYFVALQAPFTGGEDGLQSVPRGYLFGVIDLSEPRNLYGFVLAIFLGGFYLIMRLVGSPFGLVLKGTSDHESRAQSLGLDTTRYKLVAFTLSAALAGLAGATKAITSQIVTLSDVHWSMSGEVLLMTFLGGVGTLFGPVVGAFVVVAMQNYLSSLGQWVIVIHGAIFVLCVLAFRRGIVGELIGFARGLSRTKAVPERSGH
ncbi:branched-chain amino acid ABC transporter permease [Ancylobacter pratisalsi]|uniref:Branched-chain amino acid ABC transporter permease n=1 Tax=Ancylobacter pratisalsi TaxID=1745854 RepID=A0A6P1YKP3_9HYPH|nr:branched-chain amino acid ABC transporter permease [Ancylobacter pratisalsi]QIB33675.1 branched-chain amino acid ABC transporter permease [Ancylobacter pratisalsi]